MILETKYECGCIMSRERESERFVTKHLCELHGGTKLSSAPPQQLPEIPPPDVSSFAKPTQCVNPDFPEGRQLGDKWKTSVLVQMDELPGKPYVMEEVDVEPEKPWAIRRQAPNDPQNDGGVFITDYVMGKLRRALKHASDLAWEVGCETEDGVKTLLDDSRGDLYRELGEVRDLVSRCEMNGDVRTDGKFYADTPNEHHSSFVCHAGLDDNVCQVYDWNGYPHRWWAEKIAELLNRQGAIFSAAEDTERGLKVIRERDELWVQWINAALSRANFTQRLETQGPRVANLDRLFIALRFSSREQMQQQLMAERAGRDVAYNEGMAAGRQAAEKEFMERVFKTLLGRQHDER